MRGSQERRGEDRGKGGINVVLGGSARCSFDVSSKRHTHTHTHTHTYAHSHTPMHSNTHLYTVADPAERCDLWIQNQQAEKTSDT